MYIPLIIKDGQNSVHYRRWEDPAADCVLLLVHGLGGHSLRWTSLAEFFLDKNISLFAIELEGFGEHAGLKGHVESFDRYVEDICRIRGIIAEKIPGKKIFLVGESMGALICFQTAAYNPGLFDGLICMSPAFSNRLKFSAVKYAEIFRDMILNPRKQINIPFDSKMCTRDPECRKILDEDPREHRLATAGLLRGIVLAQLRSEVFARRIKMSVLFMLAGQDELVRSETSERIFGSLKTEDKTLIKYPEMRHALSIERGREKVFADILQWLRKRI